MPDPNRNPSNRIPFFGEYRPGPAGLNFCSHWTQYMRCGRISFQAPNAFTNDGNAGCTGSYANKCAQITGVDILNEDCYFCGGRGNSGSDWNGVLVSNTEGDVTMVANYSDLGSYPGVFYVSRRVTQARNTRAAFLRKKIAALGVTDLDQQRRTAKRFSG